MYLHCYITFSLHILVILHRRWLLLSDFYFREKLIQTAFQSLQLVVTDYLPIIPCVYLQNCVEVAAKFGLQNRELNISLTAIGLLVLIKLIFGMSE